MKAESKYEKYYNLLIGEIINARMHFGLYKRLQEARKDYFDELNQAPGFFSFTIKAHLDAGLMHVSRLLKKQTGSITVWKFLDFIENNLDLFSTKAFSQRMAKDSFYENQVKSHRPVSLEDVENHRNQLLNFRQVIENIITWRDKKGAHIDEKFGLRQVDVFRDFPIKLAELEELTRAIANILNTYSSAYNSSSYSIDMVGADDVEVVLDAIRVQLEQYEKQFEEEKRRLGLETN
jgi:hypothetical protein